jgi:hypothetical protein
MQMNLDLDLDELWPSAASLVGLQFTTDADYERCLEIIRQQRDRFLLIRPEDRYLIVRRTDSQLIAETGLPYREIELFDMDDLPPQERYERQREMIQEQMPAFLERLRQQS